MTYRAATLLQEAFFNKRMSVYAGIYGDKTVSGKLKYIPNEDRHNYLFCRVHLVVETLGHSTY